MSKVYEVLRELPPHLRGEAREILDAMLAGGDVVNWDQQHRLMLDNRSIPNTNIVYLVAHLLHPHDDRLDPKAFTLFVQTLKDIRLESEWVQNELVKDMLDDNDSDSEDESDVDDDDNEDDNNEQNDDNENEDDDDDENEDDDADEGK